MKVIRSKNKLHLGKNSYINKKFVSAYERKDGPQPITLDLLKQVYQCKDK